MTCLKRTTVEKCEMRRDCNVYCIRESQVPLFIQKEIAPATFELSGTPEVGLSAYTVACELDVPYAAVRKILKKVIQFKPYKIKPLPAIITRQRAAEIRFFSNIFNTNGCG